MRRAIIGAILALAYWLAALWLLALSLMGDCVDSAPVCDHGRAVAFWWGLGIEALLFAGLVYAFARVSR